MELQVKHHIQMETKTNPLDIRLTERPVKAYLVASLAFLDGAEISAQHYRLSLGAVYAAMSFYEDNRDALEEALETERKIDFGDNEIRAQDAINEFQKKMNNQ